MASPVQFRQSPITMLLQKVATEGYASAYGGGYTGTDDTACLQAALDAGLERVIIDVQAGPWVIEQVTLNSNQRIIIRPGVEIEAKSGSFTSEAGIAMFWGEDIENVDIIGYGATVRMLKHDYTNHSPYTSSKTFTAAADDILTLSGPDADILVENVNVWVSTDGTLPAPLEAVTNYYVRAIVGNTCKLSTTKSDAGIRNITDAGSGTHTIRKRPSQFRMGLALYGCDGIGVYGLTIEDTGGDGVYVGQSNTRHCSNVRIDGVTCRDFYRNGISVISCENLLITDCTLEKSNGTALQSPAYGIDFEPNASTDKLINCVVRNTTTSGFADALIHPGGFIVSMGALIGTSDPVSISFENCTTYHENESFRVYVSTNQATAVAGVITVTDCNFTTGLNANGQIQYWGLTIGKPATGFPITFTRCTFGSLIPERPGTNPIVIYATVPGLTGDTGDVHFIDCVMTDGVARDPLHHSAGAGSEITNVTGTITYNGTVTPLTTAQLVTWMETYVETLTP